MNHPRARGLNSIHHHSLRTPKAKNYTKILFFLLTNTAITSTTMTTLNPYLHSHMELIHQTAVSSFQKEPYHWQVMIGSTVLHAVASNNWIHKFCVRPTGGGKTLLFTVLARCMKGVTLCITPLLSLGSDQVRKLLNNTTLHTSTTTFHLDKLNELDNNEQTNNITRKALDPSKIVIIYVSPQRLTNL